MATYIKPYMFNIVLNSQNFASVFSGANDSDRTYLFNWTNIPEGKYKVTFSYRGLNNGDLVASDSPQVFISFPQTTTYQAGGTEGSRISNYLGTLRIETHAGGQAYFYANETDNPAMFLTSRPNTPIQIRILNGAFTDFFTTIAGSQIADYVMVLSFKKIGD